MITKSDYIKYLQCYKYLWLHKFRKDLIPDEVSSYIEKILEEGYEVEKYALSLFPQATVASEDSRKGAIETKRLLESLEPVIFQGTVSAQGLYIRSDILEWDAEGKAWNIYEVKSSTQVKDIHIVDLAFQKITMEAAGYPVNKLFVIHVDNSYVKQGEIDPKKLLTTDEVTERVNEAIHEAKIDIENAKKVLEIQEEPEVQILKQCKTPYECPFIHHCWKDVPQHSIYEINRGFSENDLRALLGMGIQKIEDVPLDFLSNEKKLRQYEAVKTGQPYIDAPTIKEHLSVLKYPLYFLDYETYGTAVPVVDGTSPYQQVVFQYSLHVQESPGAELKHYEFLATSPNNPSLDTVKSLYEHLGPSGTVISWNMMFEKGRNKEMAQMHPEYAEFLHSVNERMFDLMEIFRQGHYIHKDFKGSASIKKVLPVLVPELSYKDLNIQEGGTASESWLTIIDPAVPQEEKDTLIKDMLKYCELDTLAMVRILDKLKGV